MPPQDPFNRLGSRDLGEFDRRYVAARGGKFRSTRRLTLPLESRNARSLGTRGRVLSGGVMRLIFMIADVECRPVERLLRRVYLFLMLRYFIGGPPLLFHK